MSNPDDSTELERVLPKNMPQVTTGVRSSYDVPPERHDVRNMDAPEPEPFPGVEFSVERDLRARVAKLEDMVNALYEKFMDKPIDIREG